MTRKSRPIEERLEDACSSQPTQEQLDAIGEGVQGLGFWGNAGEHDKGEGPAVVLVTRTAEGELQVFDQSTEENFEVTDSEDNPDDLPLVVGRGPSPAGTGRPSKYSLQRMKAILGDLKQGIPLTVAAGRQGVSDDTVRVWEKEDQTGTISSAVARARDLGRDMIAYEARSVARGKDGSTGDVQRDRLAVETDLKLLACWDPRRYGNQVKVTGDRDNPVALESRTTMSDEQLAQIASKALK